MLEEKEKQKLVRQIKKELKRVPDLSPDELNGFTRINDYSDVLPEVFWNLYGEPNFTNKEMRKLDLSCISFDDEIMDGVNFSYTNIDFDPQRVKDKLLWNTNLEGVYLYGKSFDGVVLYGTNLKHTKALIDFDKIAGFDRRTRLEGCDVIASSLLDKRIALKIIEGAHIIDDLTGSVEENLQTSGKQKKIGPLY